MSLKRDYDFTEFLGQRISGRVRMYSIKKGFGFITTENGRDIFISSFSLGDIKEHRMRIGTAVTLIPQLYKERFVATELQIDEEQPEMINAIDINDLSIPVSRINKIYFEPGKYVISKLNKSVNEIRSQGYRVSDFSRVVIKTIFAETYMVYNSSCPLDDVIKVNNLNEFYRQIHNSLFRSTKGYNNWTPKNDIESNSTNLA